LDPLFKGSEVPTQICRTYTGAQEQFWPAALSVTTSDSWVPVGVEPKLSRCKSVALAAPTQMMFDFVEYFPPFLTKLNFCWTKSNSSLSSALTYIPRSKFNGCRMNLSLSIKSSCDFVTVVVEA